MALLDDVLKAGSVPLVGLAVVALAVPYFFPALRPQFEAVFKSSAKLFLEAELGADDAIADRFVDAAVGALFQATAHGTDDERKQKAASQINRLVGRAQAGARRRGWNEEDVERRYHRRLRKLDHALERARHRADPRQRACPYENPAGAAHVDTPTVPQKAAPIAQSSELIVTALQRSLLRSARNLRTRVRLTSLMAYGASFGKS